MKENKLKLFILLFSLFAVVGCEEDLIEYRGGQPTAYSFARTSQTVGVCNPTVPINVEATIASNQERTVQVSVNDELTTALASEYTLGGTSAVISAGDFVGSIDITVDFAAIPVGESRVVVLDLVIPQDGTLNTRGTTTIAFSSACTLNEATLDFVFDSYPQEFAWQLYDEDTGAFITGDTGFGNYAGADGFSTTLCLPDGNYLLRLLDSFGDGFCCAYGNGSATVTANDCDGDTELASVGSEFTGGELFVPFSLGQ
ncbi:hypothetical protein [Winogradskyella aurantia]|uniref:DUF1735 domain-containing protein n=1 Tax=Winogradskyella aurantia TaxID=1915063 RepID=A0A265UP67_9FLAO|nr:hypothetical protein [Winogradskyella aurantia]OZV67111.1 hypothetical protein CA834_12355 [Winogradskyella aurantia]